MQLLPIKYTLQLDRLTLSLLLNTENKFNFQYITKNYDFYGNSYTINSRLELRKLGKRFEKNFLNSFDLWADGNKIGTLHTDCRQPQAKDLVKFEFAKHVLYTRPGFMYYLALLNAVGLYVETVSYCEIALDTQLQKPLRPRLSYVERHSTLDENNPNPKYRPLRAKTFCNKLANGSQYTFGHGVYSPKGTGKQIVVYNKTEDIAEKGDAFITEFHHANGLDILKLVERIEAKFANKWFADNNLAIGVDDLTHPEKLKALFIKAVGDCFKFVPTDTTVKPKRNAQGNYTLPTTDLLPLGFLQAQQVEFTERWQVGEGAAISDQRKRIVCGGLVDAYITLGTQEALASLQYFIASQEPPKGTTWLYLVERRAQQFDGLLTPGTKERIATIGAYLPLS